MNNLLKILLAIFLPPVCAFIQVGLSLHFFLNIVLTLLGGLPGLAGVLCLEGRAALLAADHCCLQSL